MFDVVTKKYLIHCKEYRTVLFGEKNFKWHYCEYAGQSLPDQGWKVHISANISNAGDILLTALPYITAHRLAFKHARSLPDLAFLNSGKGGITQIGKFITIYCGSAFQLRKTLNGLSRLYPQPYRVPFIITDKRFDPDLPLFYRYGALRRNEVQNTMGVFESVLKTPSGLLPDKRENTFTLPEGIADPFKNKGACNIDLSNRLLLNKYVTFEKLSDTYKTETYFGIDLSRKDHCIIKISKPDMEIEKGIYAGELLANEVKILDHLRRQPFPRLREAFDYYNRTVMVTSLVEGINLFDFISLNAIQGIFLSRRQTEKLFLSLLQCVQILERKGILHNDLKPNNVIVKKDLGTCIIDFETSKFRKGRLQHKATNLKSRGYYNQQLKPANPDYYALGMILYFIQTGYNISDAPREDNILERPLHYLTGKYSVEIEKYISNLCGNYYHTIDAVIGDFKAAIRTKAAPFTIRKKDLGTISDSYRAIPRNMADWLFTHCIESDGLTYWNSTHRYNSGEGRTDINIGSSGILLFLSYYFATAGHSPGKYLQQYENAIKYVHTVRYPNQITGLFVGEAGKTLATITALLSIGKFNTAAIKEKLAFIKSHLPINDDFYNGKSGVGFLFLILYVITADKKHLKTAREIAGAVMENSVADKTGIFWKDRQTQKHFIGFAHGISGIGYFLIMLYRFAPDKSLWETINHIARTLSENAVLYSKKSRLINWPDEPGTGIAHNHWCNGTPGVGKFFLALYEITKDHACLDTLDRCAHTVVKASSFMNPTMCHGLSGNIDFLISYYQLTGDPKIRAEIFRLAEVLKMSGVVSGNHFLFPSESPGIVTPDFWVGSSGTAYVFQRLTDVGHHPDFLSTAYYRALSRNNSGLD